MLKKIVNLCLIIVMIASTFGGGYPARAAENSASDFEFVEVHDGIAITRYVGESKDVHIPAEINGRTVVEIGDFAFYDKRLQSVTLPDGLESIGSDAFSDNSLIGLTLPDGLESIGSHAFSYNSLTKLTLPNGLESIEESAFYNNALTRLVLPNGLESIGKYAFAFNLLTELTLPNGLESIEDYSFLNNRIEAVVIPENVKLVGHTIFGRNPIRSIEIEGNLQVSPKSFGNPSRTGYTFNGWYTDSTFTTTWDGSTNSGGLKLYAKWLNNIQYEVHFQTNGGDERSSISVHSGELLPRPVDPIRPNHTFEGWYKDAALTEAWDFDGDKVEGALTLYAKWSMVQHAVTFEANEGSDVPTVPVAYGEPLPRPVDPVRPNHTFEGWYKDAALTEAWDFDGDKVEGPLTLYAKWSMVQHAVTFEANEGSDVPTVPVAYGEPLPRPVDPVRPNHTFEGWYKDAALTEAWDFDGDKVEGALTLYAKWSMVQHAVTFEANEGSDVPTVPVAYGEPLPRPVDPVRPNHTFEGWYKDAALTEAWDFDGDKVEGALTLYARWKVVAAPIQPAPPLFLPLMWKVTFESNSGSQVPAQAIPNQGKALAPQTPEREDHQFVGWYKDAELTIPWDFAQDRVEESLTLYAKWEPLPVHPAPPIQADIFADIKGSWAKSKIEDMAKKGYIAGYPDGSFRPDAPIQRQHVALLFARALQLEPRMKGTTFHDVPADHPNYDAIVNIQRAGIVEGYQGGFQPEALVTRAQVAKMVTTAFGLTAEGAGTFKDVSPEDWYHSYVVALENEGIIEGFQGKFQPGMPVTRAQFAVILFRLYERFPEYFKV